MKSAFNILLVFGLIGVAPILAGAAEAESNAALSKSNGLNVKIKTTDGKTLSESSLKEAELGDTYKFLIIEGVAPDDVIVEQSFETSISVSNDGPHLDFTEWKHGSTKWANLKSSPSGFEVLETPQEDLPFPAVGLKEINAYYQVYKKQNSLENHWDSVIAACKSANESPCNVGVSKVLFQIKKKNEPSKVLRKIEILIPMGC